MRLAARPTKAVCFSARSRNIGYEKVAEHSPCWLHEVLPGLGPGAAKLTNSWAFGTGSARSSSWSNIE